MGFTARQDYSRILSRVNHYGGAQTGDPREKTHDPSQTELGLSNMRPELGSNPQRWDNERFRAQKIRVINHLATGAAGHAIMKWLSRYFVDKVPYFNNVNVKKASKKEHNSAITSPTDKIKMLVFLLFMQIPYIKFQDSISNRS